MRSVDELLVEAATLGLRVNTLVDTGKVCRASLWWTEGKSRFATCPVTGSTVAAALEAALEDAKAQLPKPKKAEKPPLTQMVPSLEDIFE